MDIEEILSMLEKSPQMRAESKRQLDEFKKGPDHFTREFLALALIEARLGGLSPELLLAMASMTMNHLMRMNHVSEDEMMEYIKLYK